MKESVGLKMFAANFGNFEESGVGGVEFVCGIGDLGWETNGVKKLVSKSGVDAVEAFAAIVGKTAMGSVEEACSFDAYVFS